MSMLWTIIKSIVVITIFLVFFIVAFTNANSEWLWTFIAASAASSLVYIAGVALAAWAWGVD